MLISGQEMHEDFSIARRQVLKILTGATVISMFIILFYPFSTVSKDFKVVKVYDGDTVDLKRQNSTKTLRVAGIDTPETSSYNTPEEFEGVPSSNWKCLQKWGYNAKEHVKKQIGGTEITLRYRKGILTVERGSFGRLIGEIYTRNNSESLSKRLVQKGYARSYGDKYLEEERKARKNSRGLWECRNR